jgi:formate C-acetyltransferase
MEEYIPYQNRNINDRIRKLKEKVRNSPLNISLERSLLYMESYKKTETQPVILRRAKALKHILENISIRVDSDEILVGGRTQYPRMGLPAFEGDVEWLVDELDTIASRSQDPFVITNEDKAVFKSVIYPYFRDKTLKKRIFECLSPDVIEECDNDIITLNQKDHSQGHIVPDVEKWVGLGIDGILKELKAFKERNKDHEKNVFYESVIITLQAAKNFIIRYADLAEEMGLEETSQICRNISSMVPRNFKEAVQSVWFLIAILTIESIGNAFSPGRLDRILYRYYKNDISSGTSTDGEIIDTIEAFFLKLNEAVVVRPERQAKYFSGFPMGFNIVLGGQDERGNDTTNELSYLFLKAQADLGLPQPNLSVRVHSQTPEQFLRAASYVIGKGSGMPQVFNDEAIIPALINRRISIEDARNYAIIGCVELCVPGKFLGLSNAAMLNMARLFEVCLKEKEHKTLEELEKTIASRLKSSVKLMVEGSNVVDTAHGEILPTPFLSSVIYNCVEKGIDVTRGGAFYNFTGTQAVGIANITDSIFSFNKTVYVDRELSYASFLEILEQNFNNNEVLRKRLLNKIPKYGNNVREVDDFAYKWSNLYNRGVEKYKNPRNGFFQPGIYTVSAHVPLGEVVGATPDGRLKGEPLADGGLSPMRGRDRNGATAVLQSASRIDQIRASNGTLLNLKFHQSVFKGDNTLTKFCDLLRGFIDYKLFHVQFNVINGETLKKAQKNPDAYQDLVVRVAGYSAFFVDLNAALQNDIIERTSYTG